MSIVKIHGIAVELIDLHLVGTKIEVGREHIVLATEDVTVDRKLKAAVGHLTDITVLPLVTYCRKDIGFI